jgi:hypothetical protein
VEDEMNKEEIIRVLKEMCLETYNECDKYLCVKGVNGQATTIYYGAGAMTIIREHLVQMGRDQLKMELNRLLDITGHH